jgi:ABC-type antimicrobial peptide transport system permease subunit
MTLTIALVGLYGVLSQVVAGRVREMGLRSALGANHRAIRRIVIVQGLSPVLLGLLLGLGLAFPLHVALAGSLRLTQFGGGVALIIPLFILAGFGACYRPARRASRVNPSVALKSL